MYGGQIRQSRDSNGAGIGRFAKREPVAQPVGTRHAESAFNHSQSRLGSLTPLKQVRVFLVAVLAVVSLGAQQRAGILPNGAAVLPHGWPLTPAGKQIPLSTLPMSLALSPDGRVAVALNAGYREPSLSVIDLETADLVQTVRLPDAWLGLRFNRAGDKLIIGGGARATILEASYADGRLKLARQFAAVPSDARTVDDFIGDVMLSADEGLLYAANLFRNRIEVLNAKSGVRLSRFETRARPYRMQLAPDGRHAWISHWGESSVGLYRLDEGRLLESVPVGAMAGDLLIVPGEVEADDDQADVFPVTARLFVASSNTNTVTVFGLTDSNRARLLERIPVGPEIDAPAGTEPTALSGSPDGQRLYIACSGNNLVAVADISGPRTQFLGAIPTGWRPTAVAETSQGQLLYLNGKGAGPRAALQGPDPTRRDRASDYVAAQEIGSIGILPGLDGDSLAQMTQRAAENVMYEGAFAADPGVPEGNPVGPNSPIKHVVYVIKENRSYDQVLGDLPGAEGDPELVVFGENVAPNHRKLAREFALLDNFYAAGSVSADGMSWATSAATNDFIEKLWPARYAKRLDRFLLEKFESTAAPPAGYLWSNALSKKLSVRAYGIWTRPGTDAEPLVMDPGLTPHVDGGYPSFDLTVTARSRVERYLADSLRLEQEGALPNLQILYLPNDHTAGRAPGLPTARAMMAEHDAALGALVETLSRRESWKRTAVFIVEDDAQDGADHIGAHRSIAFVASPYARRKIRDKTFYSTLSVLRTIEMILGLAPMTQFDAAAVPMWKLFQSEPDFTPFEAVEPGQRPDELNPPGGERVIPRRVEARPPARHAPLDGVQPAAL